MAIDPPVTGFPILTIKCSILPILPLENLAASCGKLYLSNLAIPEKFYRDAGIIYKSPFGHKFVIPLHLLNEVEAAKSDNEISPPWIPRHYHHHRHHPNAIVHPQELQR